MKHYVIFDLQIIITDLKVWENKMCQGLKEMLSEEAKKRKGT